VKYPPRVEKPTGPTPMDAAIDVAFNKVGIIMQPAADAQLESTDTFSGIAFEALISPVPN
jgi:hypothetical protein